MSIEAGRTLLQFRIVEKLGEGGMGVVWKATDTSLDRSVALKLLPPGFTDDPERMARFEREAKTLAALNHPNVASLYGLHEADGERFLTMECVEGEDLAKRIARGPLDPENARRIAIGIAEALAAAHGQGIVHRDLKPANVLIDPEGTPKVLDFGLAKVADPVAAASGSGVVSGASPTVTSLGTVAGMLLGTAAYMSPEQARGHAVDRRADLWALGCILYECLTGNAPFKGETISDTLAGVLRADPDWDALPRDTPPAMVRILKRCLAKDLRERFQDAGDLRYELERVADDPAAREAAGSGAATRRLFWLAPLLLVAGLVLGAGLRHLWGGGESARSGVATARTVAEFAAAPGTTFEVRWNSMALSPDGTKLAFVARDDGGDTHLQLRSFEEGTVTVLPGTRGARNPFWSPDSGTVAFFAEAGLATIGPRDAQPRRLAEVDGGRGTWSENGVILVATGVYGEYPLRIDAETGAVAPLQVERPEGSHLMEVAFLPDGEHFLIQLSNFRTGAEDGIYLRALNSDVNTLLVRGRSHPQYSAGHLVYHRGSQVIAQPLDEQTFEPAGDPFVIGDPVFTVTYPFHAMFSVARDVPRLVYLEGTGESMQSEVVWFDREGNAIERTGIVGDLYNPRLSADGRRMLLDVSTLETEGDIWLFDLARGSSRRLTRHPADESRPVWSPDEATVYFFREPDLYRLELAGNAEAEVIYRTTWSKSPHDITPDGRLLFAQAGEQSSDLWIFDTRTGEATPWLDSDANEYDGDFSPDGRWLAYSSDESGRNEVYVESFPQRGERFRVSRNGGSNPSWRADGKELYYTSLNQEIVAVPVDFDAETRPVGDPQVLFRANLRRDLYEPAPDGRRFLAVERLDPDVERGALVDGWNAGAR